MEKCKRGGMVTDCLGELPDDNNPCTCDKLKIKSLQSENKELKAKIQEAFLLAGDCKYINIHKHATPETKRLRLKSKLFSLVKLLTPKPATENPVIDSGFDAPPTEDN